MNSRFRQRKRYCTDKKIVNRQKLDKEEVPIRGCLKSQLPRRPLELGFIVPMHRRNSVADASTRMRWNWFPDDKISPARIVLLDRSVGASVKVNLRILRGMVLFSNESDHLRNKCTNVQPGKICRMRESCEPVSNEVLVFDQTSQRGHKRALSTILCCMRASSLEPGYS